MFRVSTKAGESHICLCAGFAHPLLPVPANRRWLALLALLLNNCQGERASKAGAHLRLGQDAARRGQRNAGRAGQKASRHPRLHEPLRQRCYEIALSLLTKEIPPSTIEPPRYIFSN
jgi:hypothetical protein